MFTVEEVGSGTVRFFPPFLVLLFLLKVLFHKGAFVILCVYVNIQSKGGNVYVDLICASSV